MVEIRETITKTLHLTIAEAWILIRRIEQEINATMEVPDANDGDTIDVSLEFDE